MICIDWPLSENLASQIEWPLAAIRHPPLFPSAGFRVNPAHSHRHTGAHRHRRRWRRIQNTDPQASRRYTARHTVIRHVAYWVIALTPSPDSKAPRADRGSNRSRRHRGRCRRSRAEQPNHRNSPTDNLARRPNPGRAAPNADRRTDRRAKDRSRPHWRHSSGSRTGIQVEQADIHIGLVYLC
jgi:hypothetical protein